MSKIVVFGGAGFLGSHVVDELISLKHEVTVFDLIKYNYSGKVKNICGDILDEKDVEAAIKGADYVYNFAGAADLDTVKTKAMEPVKHNICGTINILEGCRKHGVKKFLFASTVYVYSQKGGFYRCSKQSCEVFIEEFWRKYGLKYTILRFGSLYGPRSKDSNIVHSLIRQALIRRKLIYNGTGQEVREYINVRDAAKLSAHMLNKKYDNKYMIITGHNAMRVIDLLETIREIIGNGVTIERNARRMDEEHYNITPYSFVPKIGQKIVSNEYIDLGQGILECINEIHTELNHKPAIKSVKKS